MASAAVLQRVQRLNQRWLLLEDVFIPEAQRIGLDIIRDETDLEIAMKFMLEVYHEGKTESVFATEHPKAYERLQQIAGTVPAYPRR